MHYFLFAKGDCDRLGGRGAAVTGRRLICIGIRHTGITCRLFAMYTTPEICSRSDLMSHGILVPKRGFIEIKGVDALLVSLTESD